MSEKPSPRIQPDDQIFAPDQASKDDPFADFRHDMLVAYAQDKSSSKTKDTPDKAVVVPTDFLVMANVEQAPSKPFSQLGEAKDKLKAAGIDTSKMSLTVGVCEIQEKGEKKNDHADKVENMISGKDDGLCPGANLARFRPEPAKHKLADYGTTGDALNKFIEARATDSLNGMSQRIKTGCLDSKDPKMRVFNASIGTHRAEIFDNVLSEMEKNPEAYKKLLTELTGEKDAKMWIDGIKYSKEALKSYVDKGYSISPMLEYPHKIALFQAISDRIDGVLDKSTKFANAQKKYADVTKAVADKGIVIVIPVCNDNDFGESLGLKVKPGSKYNMYAQSDHVIAVGSAHMKGTGEDMKTRVAAHSSPGSERFKPTLLVQGQDVPLKKGEPVSGTSIAAPQVAATIALMLDQNPKLKFDEIKAMLQKHSTPIKGPSELRQGAALMGP